MVSVVVYTGWFHVMSQQTFCGDATCVGVPSKLNLNYATPT